jgi:hypothetical protein
MNTKNTVISAGCLILALASASCGDNSTGSGRQQAAPANQPFAVAAAADSSKSFSGKVIETMDAAGYTYVRVDTGKEKLWAAGPKTALKVGDSVTAVDGMPMANYHSKTLNRDFDVVYFVGSLQGSGSKPATGSADAKLPDGHPPIGATASKPAVDLKGITKAKGGKTIQEIFAAKATLAGKEVKVRGKVVKYNAMILGKNWLHIQDGTGAVGSNDLTVTTSTEAKVGDTVLVTGSVSVDKDFGSGYKFSLMMDDAKVVVE